MQLAAAAGRLCRAHRCATSPHARRERREMRCSAKLQRAALQRRAAKSCAAAEPANFSSKASCAVAQPAPPLVRCNAARLLLQKTYTVIRKQNYQHLTFLTRTYWAVVLQWQEHTFALQGTCRRSPAGSTVLCLLTLCRRFTLPLHIGAASA